MSPVLAQRRSACPTSVKTVREAISYLLEIRNSKHRIIFLFCQYVFPTGKQQQKSSHCRSPRFNHGARGSMVMDVTGRHRIIPLQTWGSFSSDCPWRMEQEGKEIRSKSSQYGWLKRSIGDRLRMRLSLHQCHSDHNKEIGQTVNTHALGGKKQSLGPLEALGHQRIGKSILWKTMTGLNNNKAQSQN